MKWSQKSSNVEDNWFISVTIDGHYGKWSLKTVIRKQMEDQKIISYKFITKYLHGRIFEIRDLELWPVHQAS